MANCSRLPREDRDQGQDSEEKEDGRHGSAP